MLFWLWHTILCTVKETSHPLSSQKSTDRWQLIDRWQGIQVQVLHIFATCMYNYYTEFCMTHVKAEGSKYKGAMLWLYPNCIHTACNSMCLLRAPGLQTKSKSKKIRYVILYRSWQDLLIKINTTLSQPHLEYQESATKAAINQGQNFYLPYKVQCQRLQSE